MKLKKRKIAPYVMVLEWFHMIDGLTSRETKLKNIASGVKEGTIFLSTIHETQRCRKAFGFAVAFSCLDIWQQKIYNTTSPVALYEDMKYAGDYRFETGEPLFMSFRMLNEADYKIFRKHYEKLLYPHTGREIKE